MHLQCSRLGKGVGGLRARVVVVSLRTGGAHREYKHHCFELWLQHSRFVLVIAKAAFILFCIMVYRVTLRAYLSQGTQDVMNTGSGA